MGARLPTTRPAVAAVGTGRGPGDDVQEDEATDEGRGKVSWNQHRKMCLQGRQCDMGTPGVPKAL